MSHFGGLFRKQQKQRILSMRTDSNTRKVITIFMAMEYTARSGMVSYLSFLAVFSLFEILGLFHNGVNCVLFKSV